MDRKALTKTLNKIFGWGVLCVLIAGALSFPGFLAALVIGGESGQELAACIHRKYFPVVIRISSLMIGIGLAAMYAGKERALSLDTGQKPAKED